MIQNFDKARKIEHGALEFETGEGQNGMVVKFAQTVGNIFDLALKVLKDAYLGIKSSAPCNTLEPEMKSLRLGSGRKCS